MHKYINPDNADLKMSSLIQYVQAVFEIAENMRKSKRLSVTQNIKETIHQIKKIHLDLLILEMFGTSSEKFVFW